MTKGEEFVANLMRFEKDHGGVVVLHLIRHEDVPHIMTDLLLASLVNESALGLLEWIKLGVESFIKKTAEDYALCLTCDQRFTTSSRWPAAFWLVAPYQAEPMTTGIMFNPVCSECCKASDKQMRERAVAVYKQIWPNWRDAPIPTQSGTA
jgi:hypothetical protein